MLVDGIHHVSLNVTDTDRSLGFYRDVLGLTELARPDFDFGGAWLDAGRGRQVHLIEAAVPADVGQHVAFEVADVEAVVATLRRHEVAVSEIRSVGDTTTRQAFANDPDGNRIEFTQPGR